MPSPGIKTAPDGTHHLEVDDFYDVALPALAAAGWVIIRVDRYDPTHLAGLTPTGKAFTADLVDDQITIVIAGRTRTLTRSKPEWLDGPGALAALLATHQLLPAAQR